jgi:hypothetical protein
LNRTDVSKIVDPLLRGAAPERANDLIALWGAVPDRAHLTDADRFNIGAIFGVIETTEITLRALSEAVNGW